MSRLLEGKVAIVTGASSGIGKAIAILYADHGAVVVATDIDTKGGTETVEFILEQGGKAEFMSADAGSAEDNRKAVELAVRQYGALHIAVNNAGIAGPLMPTGEYPIDGWDTVIRINLSGIFYGMRYQIPAMKEAGGGTIVNITSILGVVGSPNAPAYVASKHGIIGLTKTAALDHAADNIRVNSLGPGYILTPLLTNNLSEEVLKALEDFHPLGRLGTPEEVAELSLWLSSEKSSFVTGAYYNLDGGYLAK